MKKILYICSEPGLTSYAIGFLRTLFVDVNIDAYAYICLNEDTISVDDLFSAYGILPDKRNKVKFAFYGKNPIRRTASKFFCGSKYINEIKQFAEKYGITKIHFITQDVILQGHLDMLKKYQIYYTVHDLNHHPIKTSLLNQLKRWVLLVRRDKLLVKHIQYLVTSSEDQFQQLQHLYPHKKIFRHNMPCLITNGILNGHAPIQELGTKKNYVLFFGKIEAYKGIELLYKSFQHRSLGNDVLVIAGSGQIYFDRDLSNEKNIIFINRFIPDEEVKFLFQNARLLVLPYTSATQSAVSSIAYYFGKPVIASDIPGLAVSVIENETGLFFRNNNVDDLRKKIIQLSIGNDLYDNMVKNIKQAYAQIYNESILQQQIEAIYE